MRSHLPSVKLRSLGVWSRVLAICAGVSALTGCIIVDDDNDGTVIIDDNTNRPPITGDPMLVNIDTDVALDATPGDGVGIFVEYYAGGRYRIWTTCDTNFSGDFCPFEIYASVDTSSTISAVYEENLEGYDSITVNQGQGAVDLYLETDNDYDAVELDVTPGAILRLEAYVDGISQPRFVYWVGNGVLHEGAPTNPVDFNPTQF
ncbi:MAG: hypothetical protein IPM54_31390 [Polyangiaceae bacterium]|nr:hypothetical protein [Polyangiaceae bacterium]